MKINIYRVISVVSSALLMVAALLAFFTAPYLGSAYIRVTRRLGSELPLITKYFSLALLGNRENPFSTFSETTLWAWCLWFFFLCWPIVFMVWAIRASDFERSLAKWCLGMIAYICLVITGAALVSIGLVMPFTTLK